MSSKYPVLPPSYIINALSKLGFEKISQKGSHAKYKNKITALAIKITVFFEICEFLFILLI